MRKIVSIGTRGIEAGASLGLAVTALLAGLSAHARNYGDVFGRVSPKLLSLPKMLCGANACEISDIEKAEHKGLLGRNNVTCCALPEITIRQGQVGDLYSKLKEDEPYRQHWAERIGLGFSIGQLGPLNVVSISAAKVA